jgi:thiosulfate/3-mercaptopyruvate sulfurtransferase
VSGRDACAQREFEPRLRPDRVVDAEGVGRAIGSPGSLLVDARAAERYEGRSEPLDPVAGHIPGAVNRFFQENLGPDGTFQAPDTLREQYLALLGPITPDAVICYCGSGVTACHDLLAMEHAGLPGARLYPGSWSEWCSDPTRPVERGARDTGS